jgi:putative polyhydroxyalkanoate system protein
VPKIHFEIPHPLSAADAKEKLQRFVESLRARFQDNVSELEQSWNGDSLGFGFKTFGIKIAGTIEVADKLITVDGDLPLTAMMFKGKIESEMRQQLERLLK